MPHTGSLLAHRSVEVGLDKGAADLLDELAASGPPPRAFLRAAWFAAAASRRPLVTLVGHSAAGAPLAAIPLVSRRIGPLSLRELAGSYWPYRSFPLSQGAGVAELASMLASPVARSALGHAWRMGPVHSDDPALLRVAAAARQAGWIELRRFLGTCFVIDLSAMRAAGPWPTTKTLRKNRWLERRLAEMGALEFRSIKGNDWSVETMALFAQIERESWVAREADARDTKFLAERSRGLWEGVVRDPILKEMLVGSLLLVGGEPAAFTFGMRCGDRLHVIANSYGERYREGSPGRILLYRTFQAAADAGAVTIDWGAGDPGYKSEMGARPGPDIVDCLFVRGRAAAAIARPLWCRGNR